jgi:hypothetical protein
MRWLNLLLALAMVGFAAVQYNDPDWLLWAAYYGVPASWALIAGFRHRLLQRMQWRGALWACVAAGPRWSGSTGPRCPISGARTCGGRKKPRAKAWA